jgi:hypothetical protein
MKRLRQTTVEPVFGSLIHYYGLRQIGVRGKARAHKMMLLAAIAFNLKKYLKFKLVKVASLAVALEKHQAADFISLSFDYTRCIVSRRALSERPKV